MVPRRYRKLFGTHHNRFLNLFFESAQESRLEIIGNTAQSINYSSLCSHICIQSRASPGRDMQKHIKRVSVASVTQIGTSSPRAVVLFLPTAGMSMNIMHRAFCAAPAGVSLAVNHRQWCWDNRIDTQLETTSGLQCLFVNAVCQKLDDSWDWCMIYEHRKTEDRDRLQTTVFVITFLYSILVDKAVAVRRTACSPCGTVDLVSGTVPTKSSGPGVF